MRHFGRKRTDGWLLEVGRLFASGATAAAATITVAYFGFFNTGRDLDIKMVTLGLSILQGGSMEVDPLYVSACPTEDAECPTLDESFVFSGSAEKDQPRAARLYAVAVLKKYSGDLEIGDEFWRDWAAQDSGGIDGLDRFMNAQSSEKANIVESAVVASVANCMSSQKAPEEREVCLVDGIITLLQR